MAILTEEGINIYLIPNRALYSINTVNLKLAILPYHLSIYLSIDLIIVIGTTCIIISPFRLTSLWNHLSFNNITISFNFNSKWLSIFNIECNILLIISNSWEFISHLLGNCARKFNIIFLINFNYCMESG